MWTTQSSRTVYENAWIRVREDQVTGPGGPGIYGVVEVRHPSVFIVAIDEQDRVCLLTLDRYATGGASLEVPAGGTDGDDPLVAARRELREETGYEADRWERVGSMNALNGIASAPEHVFLARDLRQTADARASQEEEGIRDVQWTPFAEVLQLVTTGAITDGESIAALAFAGLRIGRFR